MADPDKSVLLIANHPPAFGGISTHVKYLAPFLAERGWRVVVVALSHNATWPDLPEMESVSEGYAVYRPSAHSRRRATRNPRNWVRNLPLRSQLARRRFRTFLRYTTQACYLKQLCRRHDVGVIAAYHVLSAGLMGAWLKRSLGISLVTTVFGELYRKTESYREVIDDVRLVVDKSDALLSCSRHCADSFRVLGLSPVVEPVLYGIDTQRFSPTVDGGALRRQLGIPVEARVVTYFARMVPDMGLGTVLTAAPGLLEQLPGLHFLIAGAAGELTPAAQALAERFSGRIHVHADVSDSQVPQCYAAGDLTVVPSTNARACLGLAIAESMATGRPVVATRMGGHVEVITEGKTGTFVPPEDPEALTAAVASLLGTPDRLHDMGEHAREDAVKRFDQGATNRRMEEILLSVLPSRRP